MKIAVLSPHRDDAAFSCAVLLQCAPQHGAHVQVVNICTRSNYAPFVAEDGYLQRVTELRAAEDHAYAASLPSAVSWSDLQRLDAPLRLHFDRSHTQTAAQLDKDTYRDEVQALCIALAPHLQDADIVVAPLALGGHIDHRLARAAAQQLVHAEALALYEDLPYAARLGTDAAAVHQQITAHAGTEAQPVLLSHAAAAQLRLHAAMFYPSQVEPATMHEMAAYTRRRGGEMLFAGARAAAWLRGLNDAPGETDDDVRR